MIIPTSQGAFPREYLEPLMMLTRYAFKKWNESDIDIFSAVDEYMKNSWVRQGMDRGLSPYLNKGVNQVVNSINKENCEKSEKPLSDSIVYFLADIYTYLQWRYRLSSKEIIQKIPSRLLASMYMPLHEVSISKACEKLHARFWGE